MHIFKQYKQFWNKKSALLQLLKLFIYSFPVLSFNYVSTTSLDISTHIASHTLRAADI